MDMEHGSEKMKSPEKIEEEEVDTQKEMKEVVKESGAKRKKSLPRKRRTVKRQKLEEDAEKKELKGFFDIIPREDVAKDVESLSTNTNGVSTASTYLVLPELVNTARRKISTVSTIVILDSSKVTNTLLRKESIKAWDQQDDALVAPTNRLTIGKSNIRLSSDLKSKELTLQVVYDVLKLTPFYKAFQITADVLEIYMQEFLATAIIHHHSIRFKMNNKKHIVNLEYFREMLQICPKLPDQQFEEPPF
ncbi:hypothetical protein Tco_0897066 [Tanacetum coccineum]